MTTVEHLRPNVESGAHALDELCPKWYEAINLDMLDLGSYGMCVVEQLRYKGLIHRELSALDVSLGFALPRWVEEQSYSGRNKAWDGLTELWKEIIHGKLESANSHKG
jgi:hypothetical protein